MKHKVLTLLFASMAAFSLSACSLLQSLFNNDGDTKIEVDESNPNKTKMKYTYYDLGGYNNIYGSPNLPSTGDVKLLVIPTWFTDSNDYIETSEKATVKSDIEKAYFGSSSDTGWRSVKSYFYEESYGKLNLTGTVTDWWSCGIKSTNATQSRTDNLVRSAVNWYKSKYSSNCKEFDSDSDGYIDAVVLIYGAPNSEYNVGISNSNLWAYCYWLSDEGSTSSPIACAYTWASFDFMYGQNSHVYYGGDTTNCKIDAHTYIHETGHLLGLQDYYDYAKSGYSAAGGFIMQDYNVGCHDPFSKLALGWINPLVAKTGVSYQIRPTQTSSDILILSNNFSNSPFEEYIIVEFYSPLGNNNFDTTNNYFGIKNLKGSKNYGIRLWHVDARLVTPSSYKDGVVSYSTASKYFSNNPTKSSTYGWTHACTNTSYMSDGSTNGYCSPLAKSSYDYENFRLLNLIRKNEKGTNAYKVDKLFSDDDLFYTGDSFSMSTYQNSFYKNGKFNNGETLNLAFTVRIVTSEMALIEIK